MNRMIELNTFGSANWHYTKYALAEVDQAVIQQVKVFPFAEHALLHQILSTIPSESALILPSVL
jgi:hypothetical protein